MQLVASPECTFTRTHITTYPEPVDEKGENHLHLYNTCSSLEEQGFICSLTGFYTFNTMALLSFFSVPVNLQDHGQVSYCFPIVHSEEVSNG